MATDIARFVLGWTFILAGAGLIIEGLAGLLTSTGFVRLSGTTPAFELFVGLMGVTLGGTVVAGMGRLPREGNRNPR